MADPFLGYDRNPDRLAWAVRAVDDQGREKTLFVAGDAVYTVPGAQPSG